MDRRTEGELTGPNNIHQRREGRKEGRDGGGEGRREGGKEDWRERRREGGRIENERGDKGLKKF